MLAGGQCCNNLANQIADDESCLVSPYNILSLKVLGQYISGIRLLNLNTVITEQVNGNSTT